MNLFSTAKEKWTALRRREKEKMKDMTFRQKAQYISTAWGLEIVVGLLVIIVLGFGIYFLDNATNTRILTFAIVDSDLDKDEVNAIKADFKAYLGNDRRKDVVLVEPNLSSRGASNEEAETIQDYEEQQAALTVAMSGSMDCYLATEKYVKFLDYNDILTPAENVLGSELMEKYAHLIALDGLALKIDSAAAKEYFDLPEEDCYLVYTVTASYPKVVRAFTEFVLSK